MTNPLRLKKVCQRSPGSNAVTHGERLCFQGTTVVFVDERHETVTLYGHYIGTYIAVFSMHSQIQVEFKLNDCLGPQSSISTRTGYFSAINPSET